ncbi:cadherin-like protein 26 [Pelodytes ibericus]
MVLMECHIQMDGLRSKQVDGGSYSLKKEISLRRRNGIWQEPMDYVNKVGENNCSMKVVKKRYSDIKRQMKRKLTGQPPPPKEMDHSAAHQEPDAGRSHQVRGGEDTPVGDGKIEKNILLVDLSLQHDKASLAHAEGKHNLKEKTMSRSRRAWVIDTFMLQEELPGPYPKLIGTVKVEEDFQMNYKLTGKGVDEDPKGLFHINEDDGSIYVHQKIDFEEHPMFHWKFNAINKTSLRVGTKLGIQLKIVDINDNVPKFSQKSYEVLLNESFAQGNTVYTLIAHDSDEDGSPNSKVNYRLLSQTPTDPMVEFTIDTEKGFLSFKGCLDFERNKNYKLVIEAKDSGVDIQQSSSCEVRVTVLDRNNHAPVWSASQLQSSVPEHKFNVTILRFGVTDTDTPYTSAWRAVYSITSGNEDGNFVIVTDPKTNEGLLNVVKPLDYEKVTQSKLAVLVENEEPFFSCRVVQKTLSGLWKIETVKSNMGRSSQDTKPLVVDTIDVNDPPLFIPSEITFSMQEHAMDEGTVLGIVEAKDSDIAKPNKVKYHILNDTAGWLSIDEDKGIITANTQMDRESEFVTNSNYIVTVVAIDDGIPPMTGTATLYIKLKDINDNAPRLESPYLTTCHNEEEAIISTHVIDTDLDPYSGPFHFDVLDKDYESKHLKLIENHGDTLQILKQKDAYPGNHTLHLEIYDRQGITSLQNLTVYVCECLDGNACVVKIAAPPALGGGAIVLLFLAPVLFLALCFLLCKIQSKKVMVPVETEPLNSIIAYNEEGGNKDCDRSASLTGTSAGFGNNNQGLDILRLTSTAVGSSNLKGNDEMDAAFNRSNYQRFTLAGAGQHKAKVMRSNSMQGHTMNSQSANLAFSRATSRRHSSYHHGRQMHSSDRAHRNFRVKLHTEETDIYKPQAFAEEGDLSRASSLETITIAGSIVHLASLQDLGSKFNILEEICTEHMENQSKEECLTL